MSQMHSWVEDHEHRVLQGQSTENPPFGVENSILIDRVLMPTLLPPDPTQLFFRYGCRALLM